MALTDNFDLSGHNTLGLPARARHGGVLSDATEIMSALELARSQELPFYLLGGGSNCVLGPDIRAVVGLMGLRGRSVDREAAGGVRVTAAGGETWTDLVSWTVSQGIGGVENLAGIPGTVGAAPIQNIGAYGVELADVFESLQALDTRTGETVQFTREDCRFAYRHSRFKEERGRYIVLEVTLLLPQPWTPVLTYAGLNRLGEVSEPATVMEAVLAQRAAKLPDWRVTGNVGSFFHNPIVPAGADHLDEVPGHPVEGGRKLSAGWLIEACGLKGHRHGGAGFSKDHALVIVNHGNATFEDVTELAALAKRTVKDRYGLDLTQEPITLG